MAAKTVLNYLPRESVIHKMTGTTKLAFFLLFTFASMITYNTLGAAGPVGGQPAGLQAEPDQIPAKSGL